MESASEQDMDVTGLGNSAASADHEVLKRSAALFILKTAETHNIPLSAMEILCSDVTSLVEMCLRESNAMPFAGLETNHMQTKYFKENLSLLVR